MRRIWLHHYEWIWNGRIVYCVDIEREMRYNGENCSEYGYIAHTYEEALKIVNEHPYPLVEYNQGKG